MQQSIVDLQDITFFYESFQALNKVSLSLKPGVLGLLGPNGAGKTTLMKIMLGFIKPDAGQGRIMGHKLDGDPRLFRKYVGYMPESDCLIPNADAVNLTAYLGTLSGMPRQESMKRAHEVLYYVGLEDARYRQVNTYSTGMKQRLKLAIALVHDPKLLILDEPTSGMDPHARSEMLNLIRDISQKGQMNIVMSSHILADIESTCHHVYIMNQGELVTERRIEQHDNSAPRVYQIKLQENVDLLPIEVKSHLTSRDYPGEYLLALDETLSKESFFKHLFVNKITLRAFVPETESLAHTFETVIGDRHEH